MVILKYGLTQTRFQHLEILLYYCVFVIQPEKAMVIVGFIEKHLFGNGKSLQAALDRNDKEENKEEGKEPSSQDELRSTVSHVSHLNP